MLGCAGFVVPDSFWCTEGFVPGLALYLGLGKGISAVHLFAHFCQIVEVASDVLHLHPLLHFCKWDNLVPICTAPTLLLLNWGLIDLDPGVHPYYMWLGICCGNASGVGGRGNWPIIPYFKVWPG